MDALDALLGEYNNLWQEKVAHKQSIRKLKGYLSYLTSILSLALTFMGLSTTDIFKTVLNNNSTTLVSNFSIIFTLISIPFTPIVILIASFALNDLFHIYVIGNHIGNIEKKINDLLQKKDLLTWEHRICPVAYGGKKIGDKSYKNIIAWSDARIFFPIVLSLCFITIYYGGRFIYDKSIMIFGIYAGIIVYLVWSFVRIGMKLFEYTKANSSLTTTMASLNKAANKEKT
jgi:hypothetical protein